MNVSIAKTLRAVRNAALLQKYLVNKAPKWKLWWLWHKERFSEWLWNKFHIDYCYNCGKLSRWLVYSEMFQCRRCKFVMYQHDADLDAARAKILSGTDILTKLVFGAHRWDDKDASQ